MELKIKNCEVPKSKLQTTTFGDWYEKILESFGGKDYKLSRESIASLLKEVCDSEEKFNISDFENGIKIHFYREEMTDEDFYYGEEYDSTPSEIAELYIFDDGEVYYVHKGFYFSGLYGYYGYMDRYGVKLASEAGYEYSTSEITGELDAKLGSEFTQSEEKGNTITSKIIKINNEKLKKKVEEKRKALLSAVSSALKEYKYSESKMVIGPGSQSMGM